MQSMYQELKVVANEEGCKFPNVAHLKKIKKKKKHVKLQLVYIHSPNGDVLIGLYLGYVEVVLTFMDMCIVLM